MGNVKVGDYVADRKVIDIVTYYKKNSFEIDYKEIHLEDKTKIIVKDGGIKKCLNG